MSFCCQHSCQILVNSQIVKDRWREVKWISIYILRGMIDAVLGQFFLNHLCTLLGVQCLNGTHRQPNFRSEILLLPCDSINVHLPTAFWVLPSGAIAWRRMWKTGKTWKGEMTGLENPKLARQYHYIHSGISEWEMEASQMFQAGNSCWASAATSKQT